MGGFSCHRPTVQNSSRCPKGKAFGAARSGAAPSPSRQWVKPARDVADRLATFARLCKLRDMSFTIRPATETDLPAIVGLHTQSWRAHYREVFPKALFGAPMTDYMARKWGQGGQPLSDVRVADMGGVVIGFAAIDPDREGGVFLDNLHVSDTAGGRGVGRALMLWVAQQAAKRPVWLEVLDGNAQARAIYRNWGGQEGPVFDDPLLGTIIPARRVTWDSGEGLAARLSGERVR